ncbi:MAG: FAD-dependent oxidoreductase [Proteobacteria bacterium]|nr:FAD-dependent oxidoreductase [Pseudomonadota bacterium]
MKPVDLLVIGAGPAGLAAALTAADCGLSVVVVDENPQPGGQIYRQLSDNPLRDCEAILGADYFAGAPLLQRFATSGIDYLPRTSVWQIAGDNTAYFSGTSSNGPTAPLKARFIVLATGAQERPLPLAGWTTPGAMTVGAAQILLKTAGLLPPRDVVLVGSGPLLYHFAEQVFQAGGTIQALIDTTRAIDKFKALRHGPNALRSPRLLWRGVKLLAALRRQRLNRIVGASDIAIVGESQVSAIEFRVGGKTHRLSTSSVLLHAGLIPQTNFSSALGCEHYWNSQQFSWQVKCNDWFESTRAGLFVAGDGGRIMGAEAAELSGRIAALEIACQGEKISAAERDAQARPLRQAWQRLLAARPLLDTLYPPPAECFSPKDEAIVCRCESVTASQIRSAARLGAPGPNQVKALTRAGMGACQGRMCACVTAALVAETSGQPIDQVGMLRSRYPVKPVTLEEIAGSVPAACGAIGHPR